MSYFLLTYDSRDGREPQIVEFADSAEAMDRFVAAERQHRAMKDGKGVVLLVADDVETLRRTHSHYFMTTDELLQAARAAS
jgi:hypothetical protein